jgi:hypothetical protein
VYSVRPIPAISFDAMRGESVRRTGITSFRKPFLIFNPRLRIRFSPVA